MPPRSHRPGTAVLTSKDLAFEPFQRLNDDLLEAARHLTRQEARFFVDRFYQVQEERKRVDNQLLASKNYGEPNRLLLWDSDHVHKREKAVLTALSVFGEQFTEGRWLMSIFGIGVVMTAGLLAYIDITKAPTPSSIWRLAGFDPTAKWLGRDKASKLYHEVADSIEAVYEAVAASIDHAKRDMYPLIPDLAKHLSLDEPALILRSREYSRTGEEATGGDKITKEGLLLALSMPQLEARSSVKATSLERWARQYHKDGNLTAEGVIKALSRCPWSMQLKLLAFKIMEYGIVRPSTSEKASLYSLTYRQRKLIEVERNMNGYYRETASRMLQERTLRNGELRRTYEAGRLPDGQIDRRARIYALKLFLSHVHHVFYECHYGTKPPMPYIFKEDPRHRNYIPPPNWPMAE